MGPSLLWENGQNGLLRSLPTLIELLITHCQSIFGPQVVSLLGEAAVDSGAEESDSLHCKSPFTSVYFKIIKSFCTSEVIPVIYYFPSYVRT